LIGAYTYALSVKTGLAFYFCLFLAGFLASLGGLLVSLPALRLREDYLAIVTLSFGEVLRIIVKAEHGLTQGVWGITVPNVFAKVCSTSRLLLGANFILVFLVLLLCFLFLQLIVNTPYGRVLRGIREDDLAVEALGKSKLKYKAQVFMLGSFMAGLSGGLFAQYMRFIDPYMFLPNVTFLVWIMVILGGPANIKGALLGSFLVELLNRGTRIAKDYLILPIDPNNLQYVLFGLMVILILLYRPQGILKETPVKTKAGDKIKELLGSESEKQEELGVRS
jgi:branched-chain amino acid transport system permease protein